MVAVKAGAIMGTWDLLLKNKKNKHQKAKFSQPRKMPYFECVFIGVVH